jgi:ketosteroid isomerase-like protein
MSDRILTEDLVVETLRSLLDLNRGEEFISRLDDEATWAIPGNWPYISGLKDRGGIEKFVRVLLPAGFPHGVDAEIHRVHIADDTAIIEFIGRAKTSKDRDYENNYCFVFEFRGDRIYAIREYMDTLYANVVLHT